MFFLFLFLSLFQLSSSPVMAEPFKSHFNWDEAKARCQTPHEFSPRLFMNEFNWGYTPSSMESKFMEVYNSGKRIDFHAEYRLKEDKFFLFIDHSGGTQPFPIDKNFVASVTKQLETALFEGFAEHVFFPDMGHSHLYFPKDHWDKTYDSLNSSWENRHNFYEKMFSDPKMKALYHLSEQLQMKDENEELMEDGYLQFRYWHRNFVGHNDNSTRHFIPVAPNTRKFNSVNSIPRHHSWSAGFAVSASKDGCFPYRDRDGSTKYFDISTKDPEYDPSQYTEGDWTY